MYNLYLRRINASIYTLRLLLVIVAAVILLAVTAGSGAAASPVKGYFRGDAYGSYGFTSAGPVSAALGRSAWIVCPCTGTGGNVRSNTVASLSASNTLKTAQIYNTVYALNNGTQANVQDTSQVSSLLALNGLITADAVHAAANTTANATAISSSDAGSSFVNLRVAGVLHATVNANTRIDLASLGYVILREESRTGDGVNSGGITVNMVHVFITTSNSLNLPVGAQIIVGHASSGFVRAPVQIQYSGFAYAEQAITTSSLLNAEIGRIAPIYIGCEGTNGNTVTNTIAGLNVAHVITSGTGNSAGVTTFSNGVATAKTTASVKNLNLLDGRITADAVTAVATSSYSGGLGSSSTAGSTFLNLHVLGVSIAANAAPNTRINLPGIGYVMLNEVTRSASASGASTRVNMIHVYVTTSNTLGLPVNTQILVAVASSGVNPF